MDIKRKFFDLLEERITLAYDAQKDKIRWIADVFGECMDNGGVVQLFGVKHGEEFVNELNYRAGGLAAFHSMRTAELLTRGLVEPEVIDKGLVLEDPAYARKIMEMYQLDNRDMLVVVSENGTEPVVIEMAKIYKENGQRVLAVVNKATYDAVGGTVLDYCDEYLDMSSPYPDVALYLGDVPAGQLDTTVSSAMAQMITADLYDYFIQNHGSAPVLLSANIKGADVHNNSLTDPYERRVR